MVPKKRACAAHSPLADDASRIVSGGHDRRAGHDGAVVAGEGMQQGVTADAKRRTEEVEKYPEYKMMSFSRDKPYNWGHPREARL